VSFFKKKKSKTSKSKTINQERHSKLAKEIEKMDEERHLDLQLEELTARLNTTDENTFTPKEEPPRDVCDKFIARCRYIARC